MIAGSIGKPVNGLVLVASVGVGEGAWVAVAAGVMVAAVVGAIVLVAVAGRGVSVGEYSMSTCVVAVAGEAVTAGVLLHAALSVNKTASDISRVVSVTGKGFIQFSPCLVIGRDAICDLIAGAMRHTQVVPL